MVVDLLPSLPLLPRHLLLTAMREERFHWVVPSSPGAGVPWLLAPPELTAKPPSDAFRIAEQPIEDLGDRLVALADSRSDADRRGGHRQD